MEMKAYDIRFNVISHWPRSHDYSAWTQLSTDEFGHGYLTIENPFSSTSREASDSLSRKYLSTEKFKVPISVAGKTEKKALRKATNIALSMLDGIDDLLRTKKTQHFFDKDFGKHHKSKY
jgi:hypothetical protein